MKHTKLLTLASCLILSVGLVSCKDLPSTDTGGGDDGSVTETETGTDENEGADEDLGGGSGPSTEISVASVSLSASELSFEYEDIASGLTKTLTATVTGSDGEVMTGEDVSWSSSETSVATVSDGVVTPVGSGSATITAASVTNPSKYAECLVTVASYVDPGTGEEPGGGDEPGGEPGEGGSEETVYVTSISFDKNTYTVTNGETTTEPFMVTVLPEGADNKEYNLAFYTAESPYIVTTTYAEIVEGNYIKGLAEGSCYLVATAKDGSGVFGYAKVVVEHMPIHITSITLSSNSQEIDIGGVFTIGPNGTNSTITVTTTPEEADDVSWSASTSSEYLSVEGPSQTGVYTVTSKEGSGGQTGQVIVTPKDTEGGATAQTISVTVTNTVAGTVPVTGISLSKDTAELKLGETLTVGATDTEADVTVSIQPASATDQGWTLAVDPSYSEYLTASEPDQTTGVVTLTATSNTITQNQEVPVTITSSGDNANGTKETATLTVTIVREDEYVASVTVSDTSSLSVTTESSLDLSDLSVTVYNQYSEEMTGQSWELELDAGETGATLDGKTLVSSYYPGTVTLKAKVGEVYSEEFTVTITQDTSKIHPTSIAFDSEHTDGAFTITAGGEIDLAEYVVITPENATNKDIVLNEETSSGNIYIDGTKVSGLSAGTATVTITLSDTTLCETPLEATITVAPAITGVSIDPASVSLNKGDTSTISAVITPTGVEEVTYAWSIEDTDSTGTSVSGEGSSATITAGSKTGTAVIKVTASIYGTTVEGTCTVTVMAVVDTLTLSSSVGDTCTEGTEVTITAAVNEDATNKAINWTSSDVTLTETDGLTASFTAPTLEDSEASRTITIIATAADGSGQTASITITVTPDLASITTTDVTLSFSFNDSLPDYAKLYILIDGVDGQSAGSWNTSTLTHEVTMSGNTGTYALSNQALGSYIKYALVLDYDRTTYSDAPADAPKIVYEDTSGAIVSASGTTKEDYKRTTINVSTNTSLSGAIVDPTESSKRDITVNFYFVGEEGNGNYKIPEYADGFLGGYYTDGTYNSGGTWTTPDEESTKLTEETSGDVTYYSITLDSLYNGDVTFQIYLEYTDEDTDGSFDDWDYRIDIDYTVSKYLANGSTIDVTIYQDPSEVITEPIYGSETEFYVFAFDTYNSSYYTGCMSSLEASVACFNGSTTATGENIIGTGTLGGSSETEPYNQAYVYTKAVAKYDSGATVSITFSGQDGNNTITIKTGNITIPEVEDGKIAIYFCAYESGDGNFWTDNQGATPTYSANAWAGVYGGLPSTYAPAKEGGDNCGWVTSCSSLDDFIADLASITTMVK